jgi:hypothetical protein
MALVKTVFETTLKGIFAMMPDGSKTNAWMAEQIANAIKAYAGSGQASTTDGGAAPAGVYVGAGAGTMAINADDLKSKLKITFEAAYTNDDLAAHIATDIDDACKADDTITTASAGTVTTPAGAASPFSGPGKGRFTGTKATIETVLKACFSTMNSMSKGGDDYFAAQLATAVDTYLKAGTISVNLQAPFVSGTGSGGLS